MWLWTEQEEEFSWIKKSLFRRCVLRDSCLNAGADFMEQMSKGGLFQPVGPEAFLFVDGTQRLKLWHKWCWLKRCLSPSLWWWLCWLCLGQRSLCHAWVNGSLHNAWVSGSLCVTSGSMGLYHAWVLGHRVLLFHQKVSITKRDHTKTH